MSSLFLDFCSFLWALVSRWIELVSGGVVAFAWLIYCQQTGRPVAMKAYYWILAVGLFCAAFGAWREKFQQIQATIGLRGEIDLMGDAVNAQGSCIILHLAIRNTGNPTIVSGLTADIRWKSGSRLGVLPQDFGANNQFSSENGKSTRIEPTDIIYNKVITPIPAGALVEGYAQYRLPGVTREQLWEGGYEIVVHMTDVWDNKYEIKRQWVDPRKIEERKRLLIPGSGNPFAELMGESPTPPSSTPDRGASPP